MKEAVNVVVLCGGVMEDEGRTLAVFRKEPSVPFTAELCGTGRHGDVYYVRRLVFTNDFYLGIPLNTAAWHITTNYSTSYLEYGWEQQCKT